MKKLAEIFADVLQVPLSDIGGDLRRNHFGPWDSVSHVRLITELEKNYRVSFTLSEVIGMDSLSAVCDRLRRKGIEA